MENLSIVASYIYKRYYMEYKTKIDEMKLHKLMYFSQRESLIQNGEPLFDGVFYGWKYGPVLKEIREMYRSNTFSVSIPTDVETRIRGIMDKVFEEYAPKASWSLSRLTHGEIAWKNSRIGIPDGINGDNPMELDDIRKDADRVRERRFILAQMGLI